MSNPLNPRLYNLLQQRFGSVLIVNDGVAMSAEYRPDIYSPGQLRWVIDERGETYRVNCFACGETRQRLYINHMYGTPDERGFARTFLAHCFNEDCMADADNRAELSRRIFQLINRYDRPEPIDPHRIAPGRIENRTLGEVPLPGEVISLDQLPPEHDARVYLQDRGFSIQQLVHQYAVSYCVRSTQFRLLEGRIFVPIFKNNQMVAWQGRLPYDMTNEQWRARRMAKYWTMPGFPRRLWLYNFDVAKHYPFLALVEGVTDVWAMGPYATGLLGKSLTPWQCDLLQRHCRAKPIFVVLDATADVDRNQVQEIVRTLDDGTRTGPVIPVTLPEGTDPGRFTQEANLRFIQATAGQTGIELDAIYPPLLTGASSDGS